MLLMFATLSLFAQDPLNEIDCGGPLSDPEMAVCWSQALDWEEARMRRYYDGAQEAIVREGRTSSGSRLNQARAYLASSQAAWTAYAETACQAVYENFGQGSARNLDLTECRIEMTRERTHVIWRGFLTIPAEGVEPFPEPAVTVREEWIASRPPTSGDEDL